MINAINRRGGPRSLVLSVQIGSWRDHDTLVADCVADVTFCCLKCDQPATKAYSRDLSGHPGSVDLTIFLGAWAHHFAAKGAERNSRVRVGLCNLHIAERRKYISSAWFLAFFLLALAAAAVWAKVDFAEKSKNAAYVLLLCLGVPLTIGLLVAQSRAALVKPVKIVGGRVWLKGAGGALLGKLPDYPGDPPFTMPPSVSPRYPLNRPIPQK